MENVLALQMLDNSDPLGFGEIESCRSGVSCFSFASSADFIGE